MRPVILFFTSTLLICLLTPVVVNAQSSDTLSANKDTTKNENEQKSGIFESWEEYKDNEVTNMGTLEGFRNGKAIFTTDNGKKMYDIISHSWWGYRNEEGEVYRLDSANSYKIMLTGQICIYGNSSCEITRDDKGEIEAVSCDTFYFSNGPKGSVKQLTGKKFSQLISDDMELTLQYENMRGSTYSKIITIAQRYNTKHPLQETTPR